MCRKDYGEAAKENTYKSQEDDDSDSDDNSEYTFTDCSESEYERDDSGIDMSRSIRNKTFKKDMASIKLVAEDDSPYSSVPLPDFNDEEQKTAKYLIDWKKALMDPNRNIVRELQEEFGDNLPECEHAEDKERSIVTLLGEKDDNGNIHGEAEIYYDNGDYFWGDFNHGVKEGQASVVLKNGDNYVGTFTNGYLDGFVTETVAYCDHVQREVFYSRGVRHGFYREIGPSNLFMAIGTFVNGKKSGTHWCWKRGNCFLVGPVDEENKPNGDNIFYLYPDLTTTLCGNFSHGKMSSGKMVQLSGIRLDLGIPVPEVREPEHLISFKYEPSGSSCISRSPMVRDPYEKRYVYVKDSQVPFAGEGLWAKTGILAGQVCTLFNGVRQHLLWGSTAMSCKQDWSDYRISCGKDLNLDIQQAHISTHNYRATLAHKTCHSFTPNCHFAQFWHPRFGLIMSIVADRDILVGEEIFVSYNYVIAKAPEWYHEQWFKHLREELEWSEQQIHSWAGRMYKLNGLNIDIPAPHRNTNRFQACGICHGHVGYEYTSLSCKGCKTWHHLACTGLRKAEEEWACQGCGHRVMDVRDRGL